MLRLIHSHLHFGLNDSGFSYINIPGGDIQIVRSFIQQIPTGDLSLDHNIHYSLSFFLMFLEERTTYYVAHRQTQFA